MEHNHPDKQYHKESNGSNEPFPVIAALFCHSLNPICAEQFSLHEDCSHGFLLEVGWVSVFVEDALHHHPDLGAGSFPEGPVN